MQKSWTLKSTSTRIAIVILLPLVMASLAAADSGTDRFPRYPSIEPNIDFWISIYSRYTTRQGVLHDNQRLDIVYEVLELADPDGAGGRRINRQRIRTARKKYRAILDRLAAGTSSGGTDLERVAALFGPNAGPSEYRRAARRIRCQVGQADRFRAGLIRSGAYLGIIRQIFRSHDLPEDLVYLPHVESSFNPRAYSKFGAAGIWQFTRSTGRRYMRVDYTVDERRDPIFSSHAAARLLKDNYERLHSWPLAVTAYNHGAAGMQRARSAHGDYETIFRKYRSRTFKFASRNFYSEFLAAREVAVNYARYFGPLQFDPPLRRDQVRLDRYAPAAELAGALGLNAADLRALNPALREPVFDGLKYIPKGYRLQLPAADHDWTAAVTALPMEVFREAQLPSRFHTVRRGDTAGKIARRYGVRLEDLIAANGLGPRATIYVNQNLRLPIAEPAAAATTEPVTLAAVSAPPQKKAATTAETRPSESAAVTPESEHVRPNPGVDAAVRSQHPADRPAASGAGEADDPPPAPAPDASAVIGDTVADETLAAALQPAPSKAAEAETDAETAAVAGAVLPPAEALVTGHLAVIDVRQGPNGPVGVIQVEAEETLGHYAEWLDVRAWDLRKINGFPYGRMIHLGQRIRIPLTRVDRQGFEQQRYEYHKELVEDFFSAYRVAALEEYSIRKGDTIWVLSRERFELPIWLIRRYNSAVDLHRLMPSDGLQIPVVEEIT